jgi:hypothetical protein
LPNAADPDRRFAGQRFLRHFAAKTPWTPFAGGEAQETAMAEATGGLAEVRTVRPGNAVSLDFPPHDGELVFGFVLDGSATIEGRGRVEASDAFVIPPDEAWRLTDLSPDFRLLHVTTARLD